MLNVLSVDRSCALTRVRTVSRDRQWSLVSRLEALVTKVPLAVSEEANDAQT